MPVTPHLLKELERAVAPHSPPWLDTLGNGPSPGEIDELTGSIGITLPDELKLWFGWLGASIWLVRQVACLSDAIVMYRAERDVALEVADEPGEDEFLWPKTFLPLVNVGSGDRIAADCSKVTEMAPLHYVDHTHSVDKFAILAPSLGSVLSRWIDLINGGYYTWNPEHDIWLSTEAPEHPRLTENLVP